MRLALSLLVLAVFCVSLMPAIYAQGFDLISKSPVLTYCVDASYQNDMAQKYGKIWSSIVKNSVLEWHDKLKEKSQNKSLWSFNLIFFDDYMPSSHQCDYTISFLNSHFLDKRFGNISYVNKSIEIYYGSIYDSFDGNVAYSHIMIRNVLLHEIGHSLGLTHHESDAEHTSVMQFPISALPVPIMVSDFDANQVKLNYTFRI